MTFASSRGKFVRRWTRCCTIAAKKGGRVASNDDNRGPDSYVRFFAPGDGEYVLTLTDQLKNGGPDYTYRVEIAPVAPRLKLSTPDESPRRGTGVMAVAVPRGNRQAILINAARADFRGALSLSTSGLPAGVTYEADTIGTGADVVPVVFSATAGAPLAATLATVTGRPVDPKLNVPSEFTSVAELVLGQNNVPFWTRTVESLAVAVTQEAPFCDRGDRAESPSRSRRDDGAEGGSQAQARLHRADRDRVAVEPAGRLFKTRGRHPREPGPGDDLAQRQRRGAC